MRRVMYRAWDKVNKVMYENAINNCKDSFDMVLKHPQIYEVMEYIGLTDKNNVEICECDILKEGNTLFLVVWDEKNAKFKLLCISHFEYPEWNRGILMDIIGNIYENPELIGNKKPVFINTNYLHGYKP